MATKANYESYKKAYIKKQAALEKKGLQMYDVMYTKEEFETVYSSTRRELKQLVSEGKRKVIGNVTQTMITEQSYQYSKAQGTALKKYAEATGQDLSVSQIRAGQIDWSMLREKQAELKAAGLTSKEIDIVVSQEYFGS